MCMQMLIAMFMVSSASAQTLSVQGQLSLLARIPANSEFGNINSYILDGSHRQLKYNFSSGRFDDVFYSVRSTLPSRTIPGGYGVSIVYNSLACIGDKYSEELSMGVDVNGELVSSGVVNLNGSGLWYLSNNNHYSDIYIGLKSPAISNEKTKSCVGRVSVLIQEDVH
ncbi:hypothetical protein VII00023_07559 [Vibrio ichthyoenteri ATCC 700023]|uniref:Fimbrial protein n=2 Tax=Vibrio ichthyoenteri TaxID=142461 RepID=F9S264_9VIBR|nr:hypothetical protein VII00023_07559 [Vibrio ichthyoenteri ATCC 700023]